jgi:hypothetical protein
MSVDKPHAEEIQRRVDRVLFSKTPEGKRASEMVFNEVQQMEMDLSEKAQTIARMMEERGLTGKETYNDELAVEYLANHYYLPVIYSLGRRVDYIRHIIDTDSEVRFLKKLQEYTKKPDCVLRQLDWWMFSRLDPYLDTPFIPYYDPKQNRMARFIPDFLFWGKKENNYTILFVDPKGMEQIDWERKVDGYRGVFENTNGKPKVFKFEETDVSVQLFLFTRDRNICPEGNYKPFWRDSPADLFKAAFNL